MINSIAVAIASLATLTPTKDIPATMRPEYIAMVDSADYYIASEMWLEAKRCTIQALKYDPANFNNAMLFSNLGVINLNLGLTDEAIDNFTLGLNIAPASSTLRSNRARALLLKNDYIAAQADLTTLTEADPTNDWAWKMLGITYLATNNIDAGMTALNRIAEPDADTLRLLASVAVSKNDLEKAAQYYDRLLAISPSEDSWFDHAWFYLMTNDLASAKEDVKEGIRMYPRSGRLVLLRGYIHRLMHENALAEADRKLAMEYGVENELIDTLFPTKKKKK